MLQEWSLLVLSGHFVDQKIATALTSRKPGNHSYEHGLRAKKIHKDKTMTCPQIPRKAHSAFCIQKCLKNNSLETAASTLFRIHPNVTQLPCEFIHLRFKRIKEEGFVVKCCPTHLFTLILLLLLHCVSGPKTLPPVSHSHFQSCCISIVMPPSHLRQKKEYCL